MTIATAHLGESRGAKCRVTYMATAGKCLAADLPLGSQITTHLAEEIQVAIPMGQVQVTAQTNHISAASNPTLKFAPFGRWDAPSARPLALR